MSSIPLAVVSSGELSLLNKRLKSTKIDQIIEKLKELEQDGNNITIVQTVKQYTRLSLILLLLNVKNKDTGLNKLKFSNSLGLLFSIRPLIKNFLDSNRYAHDYKINRDLIANILTLVISFAKYPTDLRYQRTYLSIYLTVASLELVIREFTNIKNYWLLFPLTFAKTWEYYNMNKDHCPGVGIKVLDFLSSNLSLANWPQELLKKSEIICLILPVLLLKGKRQHDNFNILKLIANSVKLTTVTISVTTLAKLLTLKQSFKFISSAKLRLQIIGFISSLPTIVYPQNSALWIYLTRVMMISMNRKHSINSASRLNRFKIDKLLIISSLLIILNFKDKGKLPENKLLDKLAGAIKYGHSMTAT